VYVVGNRIDGHNGELKRRDRICDFGC
jgi:hypothetical protein